MTFRLSFLPIHRSRVLNCAREMSSLFWSGSVPAGELSASRSCLRRFILVKLVTVLLLPRGAAVAMLLGCAFSLQALLLLRSAHVSTKPSTVLLAQLALSDGLVLMHWALPPAAALAWRVKEMSRNAGNGSAEEGDWLWWRGAVGALCQQLLDAHHLASLLLLGLLGLEATLVLRWPEQTRRFRTSQRAQLCCSLVWILALTELGLSTCLQQPRHLTYSSTLQHPFPLPVPAFSPGLRQILWLGNVWLHYFVFHSKPQKRKSSFH
ncbi:uncharacterized protein LOC114865001 [Betta splendens]|uniref:Uncharacterized protein LOC114865001 n=1 Tax=Betta splendens TaxID=158456 RepID=A0A6P7NV74_BETSP|nr:uncharacterized protein LOC114865001 [Betta splendens]